MLLTIHNLPPNIRYADVKSLITEKCGLTEVILDNLVNEGKGKKVTVGLANDDDGALVVRKINGLYLQGQQLYIEDRRRKTDVHNQPYRASTGLPESRSPEPVHPNSMMTGLAAPNVAMAWNYGMAAAPYMVMPVDQNFAYPSYGGAPQAMQYMEPQPMVPAATERGYSGFQGEGFAPGNGPRNPDPVAWNRSGREQPSDSFRQKDRKRHHSPDKPSEAKKKGSRWSGNEAPKRRERSPPRQQRPQERNQGLRPQLRQPEQFPRNQNQYQPREPIPDNLRTDPQWEPRSRWDDPKPRSGRDREWEGVRDRVQNTDQVWDDQPNPQWRDEPRQWDDEPKPEWDNQQNPQWDDQPSPRWERDSRMPMEEMRPEWRERHPTEYNPPDDFPPRQREPDRGFGRELEPRQRDVDFNGRRQNDRNVPGNWNRDRSPGNLIVSRSENSSSRQVRREDEMPIRDHTRPNNARQGRDRRKDRSPSPRARSGSQRGNPDYWGQVANNYPESRRSEFDRRDAPNPPRNETYRAPRNDRNLPFKPDAPKNAKEAKKYPPVDRRLPPQRPIESRFDNPAPIPKKPQTLTSMINRDHSNRGQAAAAIAKRIIGLPAGNAAYVPVSALDSFIYKQLKLCIRSRIDVILGEGLSSDIDDIVKRYRSKFPTSGDRSLLKQVREKSTKEYNEREERLRKEQKSQDQINVKKEDGVDIKQEPGDKEQNKPQDNSTAPDEADPEVRNDATKSQSKETAPAPKPVPVVPKLKTKGNKPLTNKQVIQQMKLQRKAEFEQDDLYNLDPVSDMALTDELAELDKLFLEEASQADDPQEQIISQRITSDSLNDFNKSIRLLITKRFLNIETGLIIRIFSSSSFKPPKKAAIEQYLNYHKVKNPVFKKSVKGTMYIINLCRFKDFDHLCGIGQDVIDGTPVNFKPMHLTGPPTKVSRNQVKSMRQQRIQSQIEPSVVPRHFMQVTGDTEPMEGNEEDVGNINPEFEEADDYTGENEGNMNPEELDEANDYMVQDEGNNPEETEDFTHDVNAELMQDVDAVGFNDDELEDF